MKKEVIAPKGLIPVVLGVSGHRDVPPSDVGVLTDATRSILSEIEIKTPNSPHILISCLAEGADRIVAHCALKMGWTLGTVLPASTEVYELDFLTQSSKDEYRKLLKASAWVECQEADGSDLPDYWAAGVRVMQQSQILLAYWDGKSIGLKGGTSDIVEHYLTEIPNAGLGLTGNALPDARPVVHVLTRREKGVDSSDINNIGKIEWLAPNPAGMSGDGEIERWNEVLRRIDLFNADARQFVRSNTDLVMQSRSYLDDTSFDANIEEFLDKDSSGSMFALADAMSVQAQKERNHVFLKLAGLAAIAIVFEQIYSGPYPSPLVLGLALLSAVVAAMIYKRGLSRRLEERYLDYRSLAEACRVQYFWNKAGIHSSVIDNFLLEQRDELEWIRQAVNTNDLSVDIGRLEYSEIIKQLELVENSWIEGQRHYYMGTNNKPGGNKAELNKRKDQSWSMKSSALFMSGIGAVALLAVSQLVLVNEFQGLGSWLVTWSGIAYGLLFSAAGLVKVYQEVGAFRDHSKSYRRSGLLMQRAKQRLHSAILQKDLILAKRVIYEAGCEALKENGDWVMLHRDRPVEVPLG